MHLDHLFSFYRFHPQMSAHSSHAWQSSLIWLPIFLWDLLHLLHSLCLPMNVFIAIHARPYDIWQIELVVFLYGWFPKTIFVNIHYPLDVFQSESYPPQRGGFFCLQGKLCHYIHQDLPFLSGWLFKFSDLLNIINYKKGHASKLQTPEGVLGK